MNPSPPGIASAVIMKSQDKSSLLPFISIHLVCSLGTSPSVAASASSNTRAARTSTTRHRPVLPLPVKNVHLSAKYLPIHPSPHGLIAMSWVIHQRFPGAIAHPFPHILEYLTNGSLHPPSEPVVAGHHFLQRRHSLHNPFNLNLTHIFVL